MVKTSPHVLIRSDGSVYHKRASLWQRQTRGFVSVAWGPFCVTYLHTAYTIALCNEIEIAKKYKNQRTRRNTQKSFVIFLYIDFLDFFAIFIYCWHVYSRPCKNWANCMEDKLFNEIQVTIILVSSFSELIRGRSQISLAHWVS